MQGPRALARRVSRPRNGVVAVVAATMVARSAARHHPRLARHTQGTGLGCREHQWQGKYATDQTVVMVVVVVVVPMQHTATLALTSGRASPSPMPALAMGPGLRRLQHPPRRALEA